MIIQTTKLKQNPMQSGRFRFTHGDMDEDRTSKRINQTIKDQTEDLKRCRGYFGR